MPNPQQKDVAYDGWFTDADLSSAEGAGGGKAGMAEEIAGGIASLATAVIGFVVAGNVAKKDREHEAAQSEYNIRMAELGVQSDALRAEAAAVEQKASTERAIIYAGSAFSALVLLGALGFTASRLAQKER